MNGYHPLTHIPITTKGAKHDRKEQENGLSIVNIFRIGKLIRVHLFGFTAFVRLLIQCPFILLMNRAAGSGKSVVSYADPAHA
jgi:hypothetical protein